MNEQLISFEAAKLAKEKGFDLKLNNFYCDNYSGLCSESEEFLYIELMRNGIYDCNNEFEEGQRYSAPTQSLLQKWLREKYKIHVQILPYNQKYLLSLLKYGQNGSNPNFDNEFNSYEEALEEGLFEALKLI